MKVVRAERSGKSTLVVGINDRSLADRNILIARQLYEESDYLGARDVVSVHHGVKTHPTRGSKPPIEIQNRRTLLRIGHPTPLSNCLIRHTCKMLIRLEVCVCYGETVREGFERTESNTESNCALFSPMAGGPWHTQNEPEPRVARASRK